MATHGDTLSTVNYPGSVGARVYDASNQSVNSGATDAINFDTESYDTDTFHDTVTNNTRLTAPVAGRYLINGQVNIDADGTGDRYADIFLNATTIIAVAGHATPSARVSSRSTVSTIQNLAATDYVELRASQNSGGALNVVGGAGATFFEMTFLGPQT